MSMTQCELIARHLEEHGSITALEALDRYGAFRLAARIKDLKDAGVDIKSTPWKTPGGATIARYSLVKKELRQAELGI